MRFSAAVLRERGKAMALEDVSLDAVGPGQVLVRIHAAGVCHTDYEAWTGAYEVPVPTILGHEGAGIVEAVGCGVTHVKPGDAVVCSAAPACGGCYYCSRELPMLCETPKPRPQGLQAADGSAVGNFLNVSSFAQYSMVPAQGAIPIPAEMPLDRACILGCAVITGVGAVERIAEVTPGESVVVIGCGAVGLNVVQGARMAGAESIVVVDTLPSKLERARAFGATHSWLAADENLVEGVRTLTAGRGADHVFECAGVVDSLQLALDLSRPGATVTILGKTDRRREVPLRFGSLMSERRIRRASLGGARFAEDIPAYASAYLDGRLLIDEQIDARVPLARVGDAFRAIESGGVVRTVVTLDV